MHFGLTEEQSELAETVAGLLAKRSDGAAVRRAVELPHGYDDELWSVLCEQVGVAALAIPEEYGGAGYSLFETHVVLEELGAALTPGPLLGSGILSAQALLLSGDESACAALLPGIAAGTSVGALAWVGADGWTGPDPAAGLGVQAADDRTLRGSAHYVLDGDAADVLLVLARTPDGIGLFRVDAGATGVRVLPTPAMDRTLRLATVKLDGADGERIGGDAAAWLPTLHDVACTAATALQVGAAQRLLEMTVGYSRERVQFGRPIGSFQALKHRMADMLVRVETARSVSWAAAWSAAQRDADLSVRAATAKAWCSDALNDVAAEAVQLHGGIAITWEHDVQLYFKRAHALSQLFGQPHQHRRRLAASFGISGAGPTLFA